MENDGLGRGGEPNAMAVGAGVELARMLGILKRALLNWKPSALILALGLIAGVTVAVVKKPSYRSETIVIYRQGVRLNQQEAGASMTLGTRLQEMLLARARLETMLDELGLYQDVKAKRGAIEAVEEFRADIRFTARSTDTFSISYKGKDPETVQTVTSRLAQSLIDENQRLRVEQARVQSEFLLLEKSRAGANLKEKERLQAQFLAEHPEFALDQNAGTSGVTIRAREREQREGGGRDATLDALRRQSYRLDAALTGGTGPSVRPEAPADPEAEGARQQAEAALAAARSDLNGKRSIFTDEHPDVKAAKGRVAEAEAALRAAEEKVRQSRVSNAANAPGVDPATAAEKLKEKKRKLDAEIAARQKAAQKNQAVEVAPEANAEASSIVGLETDWARLSRDVAEARDQMNELERNYFRAQIEASSSLGGYSDQVVVLDPPYLPTRPEPPGKTLIVLIAAGASLFVAMLVALLRALLDDRIYEEADLARVSPVLCAVPRPGGRRWWSR